MKFPPANKCSIILGRLAGPGDLGGNGEQLCEWAELLPASEIRRGPPHTPRRSRSRKPQQRVNYQFVLWLSIKIEAVLSFPMFWFFIVWFDFSRHIYHNETKTNYNQGHSPFERRLVWLSGTGSPSTETETMEMSIEKFYFKKLDSQVSKLEYIHTKCFCLEFRKHGPWLSKSNRWFKKEDRTCWKQAW